MSNSLHDGRTSIAKGRDASLKGKSQSLNNHETQQRRIIFPSLYPKPSKDVRYYGSRAQQQQQQQQLQLQQKQQMDANNKSVQTSEARTPPLKPELERSLSFPKNGLKRETHHTMKRGEKILPLPELPELKPRPLVNERRGMRIRDSICIRKAALPDISADHNDAGHATLLSGRKWVVQSPQIDSLSLEKPPADTQIRSISHRTYYPAASVPCYHEPVDNATPKKPLPSILRSTSNDSLGNSSRRSSILFRKSSTVPLSPDVTLSPSQQYSTTPTSCLTLASPTSIRSLNSELDTGERENIGETESDLNRITTSPKVIPRQDNTLRRNASDTVVIKSEEEFVRRKSIHLDEKKIVEEGVTRHESLECLPNHKRISFDPHIWVFEYKDDRHEFEAGGKWFTECELDRFKEDAIQRIRQRNSNMMSAGQGRIAMVPAPQDRGQNASPIPNGQRPVVFTHPALGTEEEYDLDSTSSKSIKSSKESLIQDILSREMRNVLVVDPHEVCLNLFTKCFKYIIPHVSVATARSGEEALARIQAAQKAFPVTDGGAVHGFDIIIVEERLCTSAELATGPTSQCAGDDSAQKQRKITSGSALIQSIVREEQSIRERVGSMGCSEQPSIRFSLLVGVSAYISQDETKLKDGGADFVFGKPPPEMNSKFRNEMLKILMKKRNNDCSLFD